MNFPALLLALWWRRFNTMGAVVGMLSGLIASTALIVLSAPVWPGADSDTGSPLGSLGLDNPAIFCIPIGFLGCYLGTVLSKEKGNDREYHELYVRSETGLGSEGAEPVRGQRGSRVRGAARRSPWPRWPPTSSSSRGSSSATRTINPPGDEAKAASLLAARLEAAGPRGDVARARAGADEPRRADPHAAASGPRCA